VESLEGSSVKNGSLASDRSAGGTDTSTNLRRPCVAPASLASLLVAVVGASSGVIAQTPEGPDAHADKLAPPFRIQVESNFVTVRVVVRDTKGHTVPGLHKQDFRLSEKGKPLEIAGFAVETTGPNIHPLNGLPASAAVSPKPAPGVTPDSPLPQRFMALYFDDLHMDTGSIGATRNAIWRYLSTLLAPEDRVAVFTSSNQAALDFTGDRDKLHDVLFRLGSHSRVSPLDRECPAIGEYQAYLIAEQHQTEALEIAEREGWKCQDCQDPAPGKAYGANMLRDDCQRVVFSQVQGLADQIWSSANLQSLYTLEVLDGIIKLLAVRPGQRSLVLFSMGFLTATREHSVNALIERAVRQKIVVNTFDAGGLYTKTPRDAIRPELQGRKFRMESEGLTMARDIMAELAEGTGGKYFHNSNDFEDGVRQAAQAPEVYYVLSFPLHDTKLDGKFHPLTVSLNVGDHWDIQARRGYFAVASTAESASTKNHLASAVYSQDELQDVRRPSRHEPKRRPPVSSMLLSRFM
jgi:VWFA-related protein